MRYVSPLMIDKTSAKQGAQRRRDILAAVQTLRYNEQAITFDAIAQMTGQPKSSMRYHLKKLRLWGYITYETNKTNTMQLTEWKVYDESGRA